MAKEKSLAVKVEAKLAHIQETAQMGETEVAVPHGFEGGKEVSSFPPTVEFAEPGEYVAGHFAGMKDHVGPNDSKLYYLELPNTREVVAIWGSTILDSKIMSSGIKNGDRVLIQRIEDVPAKKKGQSPAKNFRVKIG